MPLNEKDNRLLSDLIAVGERLLAKHMEHYGLVRTLSEKEEHIGPTTGGELDSLLKLDSLPELDSLLYEMSITYVAVDKKTAYLRELQQNQTMLSKKDEVELQDLNGKVKSQINISRLYDWVDKNEENPSDDIQKTVSAISKLLTKVHEEKRRGHDIEHILKIANDLINDANKLIEIEKKNVTVPPPSDNPSLK